MEVAWRQHGGSMEAAWRQQRRREAGTTSTRRHNIEGKYDPSLHPYLLCSDLLFIAVHCFALLRWCVGSPGHQKPQTLHHNTHHNTLKPGTYNPKPLLGRVDNPNPKLSIMQPIILLFALL
jgi:hypothetical protein